MITPFSTVKKRCDLLNDLPMVTQLMNSRTEIQTHDCFTQKFRYFLLHLLPAKNNGVDVETKQEAGGGNPAYKIRVYNSMTSTSFLMVAGKALILISTHSEMKNKLSLREAIVALPRPQSLLQRELPRPMLIRQFSETSL